MGEVEQQVKELMLGGLAGDAQAYRRLLERLGDLLRAYFRRRLPSQASDVEDLVQDTLLAIHLKRDVYDPREPFTPWAYAIARYKLLEHLRRQGRSAAAPLEEAESLCAEENPEAGAIKRDVLRLLAGLSARQRKLVIDIKLLGLSTHEAAASSGVTPGAAKVGLHRGLQALKRAVNHGDG